MSVVGQVLIDLTYAYLAVLFFRFIMSYVFQLSPNYRAGGVMSILLEVTYSLTDPPLSIRTVRTMGLPPSTTAEPSCWYHSPQAANTRCCSSSVSGMPPPWYASR